MTTVGLEAVLVTVAVVLAEAAEVVTGGATEATVVEAAVAVVVVEAGPVGSVVWVTVAGAGEAMSTAMMAEVADTLPATSVTVAVSELTPSASLVPRVTDQAPLPSAVPCPSGAPLS